MEGSYKGLKLWFSLEGGMCSLGAHGGRQWEFRRACLPVGEKKRE